MLRAISLLLALFIAKNLNADFFDPFYFKTERDYIKRLSWVEKAGQPFFYFHVSNENAIEKVILLAQKLKLHLSFDQALFKKVQIKEKGELKWVYFLPIENIKDLKIEKNRPLSFEWVKIPALHIYRTSADLVYAIKTRTDIYWLSLAQEEELKRLKDRGANLLKINLSAIKAKNPYRAIPVAEVFVAVKN